MMATECPILPARLPRSSHWARHPRSGHPLGFHSETSQQYSNEDFFYGPVPLVRFSGNHRCVTATEFQRVFDEHKNAIYRFAWRMTSSAAVAEDIAQDVFLSLFRHPNRFDLSRGTMRAFLLGIARNVALKRWRDEKRWEELGDEEFVTQRTYVEHIERSEIAECCIKFNRSQRAHRLARQRCAISNLLSWLAGLRGWDSRSIFANRLHTRRSLRERGIALRKVPLSSGKPENRHGHHPGHDFDCCGSDRFHPQTKRRPENGEWQRSHGKGPGIRVQPLRKAGIQTFRLRIRRSYDRGLGSGGGRSVLRTESRCE